MKKICKYSFNGGFTCRYAVRVCHACECGGTGDT